MIQVCDFCNLVHFQMFKVPCGYYIEKDENIITLVIPTNEEAYRNVCRVCVIQSSEEKEF